MVSGVTAIAALMVCLLGGTPFANADPQAGVESASATVDDLQASGYDVQINYLAGNPNVPLSECKVTAIRNFNGPMASLMMLSTVAVDVSCPNAK